MQPFYIYLFSFVLGICLGSFYNVCIYRYIKEESITSIPSHCPVCGHYLRWWENIPLVSYILLKGKCTKCKSKISIRYFIVELISGVWSLLIVLKFGISFTSLIFLIFGGIFIVLSFIDLKIFILPDILTIPGSILAFLAAPIIGVSTLSSIAGAILGSGFFFCIKRAYRFLRGIEGLGGGDIKLMFMVGALFGTIAVPFVIFIGSIFALIGGFVYLRIQKKDTTNPIPFGPFLCGAAMVYIFIGKELIYWYLNSAR